MGRGFTPFHSTTIKMIHFMTWLTNLQINHSAHNFNCDLLRSARALCYSDCCIDKLPEIFPDQVGYEISP